MLGESLHLNWIIPHSDTDTYTEWFFFDIFKKVWEWETSGVMGLLGEGVGGGHGVMVGVGKTERSGHDVDCDD